ncbi:SubName: Full=Related to proteophosphoglycan ppg4-Leishmania braziliensis {ECO:0000313/EMBL:CCA74179.1} [Serendipita indica DSM 11827]|nr:SubName: Full=Related to proteophosphoglycan ppg4-Leishmania braziliensis {ECO:0000313/EMBL:CCA74179.1} [Serendipita indica DSM 11827]
MPSADGPSNITNPIPLPAGQTPTDSDPHDHTPRPNSHLESWRFDSATGRFVPHTFEGNIFGRPSGAPSSNADGPQSNETNDGPRVPEIILQTSTDISVHGPDGQQLPPEASQFLLRMLGSMGGGQSTTNGPSPAPNSASGTPAGSTSPNTGASQTTTSTAPSSQSTEPMTDGPNPSRSGPSFFDLLRELAALQERQTDPPPDTRRAKQLLRGLPVVSHGLIRRLQRVETLKARALAQKQGASAKEVEETDNKLLCLVCYDALLPETEPKQTGDVANAAKDDGMKVDDEDDDMDLDVPTDVSPSDSKANLPLNTTESKPPLVNVARRWPYQAENALIALPCTHVFHATCLKPWFETGKTTCPTCRFDIDPGSDSLDLADWLSPRRRRRQREQRQREREREQAANGGSNTEDAAQDGANTNTAPTPAPPSATPTLGGNDEHPTVGGPPSGMPSQLSQAIQQAMVSAIVRAIAGERPPSAPGPTPAQAEPDQNPSSQSTSTPSDAPNTTAPPANPSNTAIPPPPPGFPLELLHLLSRTASPGYPMEGVIFGGSFDISPATNGDRASSPTPSGSQRSTSAPPSARTQPTPTNAGPQSPAPSFPAANASSSISSASARPEPRAPFLSAGLGPNGMSPFRRLSSFLSRPFGPPASSQPTSSTPTTGSSTSSFATGSRPSTPSFRHHPYASSRPSNQANNQTQAQEPESQETSANGGASNGTNGNPRDGFMTTHTISFTFEIPLGLRVPRGAPQNNEATPGASQDESNRTQTEPGAQAQDGRAPPVFGLPPGFLFGGLPFGAPFGFGPVPPFNPFDLGAGLGAAPGANAGSSRGRRQKKKWVAPEGSSLRSVVEAKEREVGLRCDDVSCLFGPEDEDEEDNGEQVDMGVKPERVYLKKPAHSHSDKGEMAAEEPACTHRLHPECLLVSSRIADPFLNDAIDKADEHDTLEVGCPICRTRGVLSVPEWRRLKRLADQV